MPPTPATWDGQDSQGHPLTWDSPFLTWDGLVPQPQTNKMPHLRVSLSFASGTDHFLEDTANAVSTNLYGNAAYPSPPVTKVALDAGNAAFSAAIAAMEQGGTAATAAKNDKRAALIGLLRQLARYVEDHCNNDLATLLASGFQAVVGGGHAPTPAIIPAPTIRDILNGNSGQLILRVTAIAIAHGYEVRYAAIGTGGTPGPWQDGGNHTNSRSMPVSGLTPGTTYAFQVRTVGAGSGNYSDWSDAVSHMSM